MRPLRVTGYRECQRTNQHECRYFSRSPEMLVDLRFVFENILVICVTNATRKQMRLAFVFWSKKHKHFWPDFTAFVAKAQTRVATLMFGSLVR